MAILGIGSLIAMINRPVQEKALDKNLNKTTSN